MTLPVDSLQVSSAAAAPFLKVFSIPELAGHINQYLRFADELRLRLASKALSELYRPDLQFKIVISDDDAPVDHWTSLHRKLGPRIRSLHLAVGPLTLPQNATLEAVYQHCGESLERLSIEYQGKDAKKLEDILAHFPRIQELSINIVPDMKVSDAMNALINLRKAFHRVARDGGEMVLLSALAIRFQEPQTVDWALLKEVLAFHPELKTLALDRLYIFERHYRGVTDDTTKEDNVDIVSTLEQLDRMSLGYGEEASGRPFTHPSLKTLVLKHCDISESRFGNMHKLFPDLHSLEMEACGGQWTLTLTKPPKAYQELLFPQLRTLKVFMVYQSSREDLVGFFRGRPHLINLETDIRSIKRDGLLELAQYCSSSLEEVSTTEDEAEATTVEDLAVVPRHKLKELSLQTYWSEDYSVEELEEFYGQPCFHELEYVYIQSEDLTMRMFPFANTLRRLCLGGVEQSFNQDRVREANMILRQLPQLEVLRVERYLDNYELFSGLGDEAVTCTLSEQQQDQGSADVVEKGPFLREISFFVCNVTVDLLEDAICDGERLSLRGLKKHVVERFKYLEKLEVHVHTGLGLPDAEEFDGWKEEVWKARGDYGRAAPVIELVPRRGSLDRRVAQRRE